MKSPRRRPTATTACEQGLAATIGLATALESVLDDRDGTATWRRHCVGAVHLRSSRVHHRSSKAIKLHDPVAPCIDD